MCSAMVVLDPWLAHGYLEVTSPKKRRNGFNFGVSGLCLIQDGGQEQFGVLKDFGLTPFYDRRRQGHLVGSQSVTSSMFNNQRIPRQRNYKADLRQDCPDGQYPRWKGRNRISGH